MESKDKDLIKHAFDLARLSQNLLKGEALTQFINSSYNKL
jgi:molecular chaperone HtpG